MHSLILTFFIISSLLCVILDANAYFPPPLKQISHGVLLESVTCTEGHTLVIKTTNNLPACVYFTSVDILIQRGWAMNSISISSLDTSSSHLYNVNSEHKIAEKAQAILDYALEKEHSELEGEYIEAPTDDGYQIAFYDISENNIILSELPKLPSNLLHWQKDIEKHQEIWDIFTKLIPESQRNVNVFYITTDGFGGIGGGIERDVDDVSKWHLFYDISDAYPTEIIDDKEIIYTTIHEFGHIITSGLDQIDVDLELTNLLYSDDVNETELDELFQITSEKCFPKTMVADGCAKSDSYINIFYQKFWADIISEWDEMQYIENEDEFLDQSDLFYDKYQNRFLTIYSSTNIDEDIAESWAAFVLRDKPKDETMFEQKILFFYDFPELVDLREHIRQGL